MSPKVAVVTLTIGEKKEAYERFFVPSIKAFAEKWGYDFKQITDYIDPPKNPSSSHLTKKYEFCIQKILVSQLPWVDEYDWIIIIDADILMNYETAPNLVEHLVDGKICVVNERSLFGNAEIVTKFWKKYDPSYPPTAQEYYSYLGFPESFQFQANSGFVCFQPRVQKKFFRDLYEIYAPRIFAGEDLDGDQGPLNYEGQKQNVLHFLDERWNRVWLFPRFIFYGFLNTLYNRQEVQQAFKTIFDMSYAIHMTGTVDWDILL